MSSKKMRIALIAMLALLGLAGGSYALVDHLKNKEEQAASDEEASLHLFSFSSNDVTGVEITNPDGYFKIDSVGGVWTLSETDYPHTFTLNDYYLNVISASMSDLTALRKMDADPSQLSAYGLDAPVTVTCRAGDQTYTLYVGAASATKEYYYVMLPEDDTVYGIGYDDGEVLRGGIGYLRSAYMLGNSETDITEFSLDHNGSTAYDLYKDDAGQWQLRAPVTEVNVNTVQITSILTDLVRIEYESFEEVSTDQNALAKYGLDNPAYTFTVKTGNTSKVLQFPEFDPNDAVIYVYEPETGSVGTIAMNDNAFLTGKWMYLLDEEVLRVPFADAAALDVTVDDMTFTMTIDRESQQYKLDNIDITAIGEDAAADFEYLYASVSKIAFEEIVEAPQLPEDPQPACTFRYTLTDGTERVLELVPIDDVTYWAYVDGRCLGMQVRRNALSGTSGVLNFLEKLTDTLAEQGIPYSPRSVQSETVAPPSALSSSGTSQDAPTEKPTE